MCLPSHTAPRLNLKITSKGSVEFQMEIKTTCCRDFRCSKDENIDDFTLLFCKGRL